MCMSALLFFLYFQSIDFYFTFTLVAQYNCEPLLHWYINYYIATLVYKLLYCYIGI